MVALTIKKKQELLRLVPVSLREGGLALGATRGRATSSVLLPATLPVIVTCIFLFFFQAEDDIRPLTVTGVQTCALPISVIGNIEQAILRRVLYASADSDSTTP